MIELKGDKKPLVCIVIVNWNGENIIKKCLDTLISWTVYPNYRILVLDNGSSDDSVKVLDKYKNIDIILNKNNEGFTKASNKCYKHIMDMFNPKYILNMNNDIITLQEDWLDIMVDTLESHKNYGICGNKLVFEDDKVQLLFLERNPKGFYEKDKGQYDYIRETIGVGGANILIKTDVIKKIGGTDENYFFGPDDIDFCLRAGKVGFKIIYNGFSKSVHLGSQTYSKVNKTFIYKHMVYGKCVFSFRHEGKIKGYKMIIRQMIRALVVRKYPYKKITINNMVFCKDFIKRLYICCIQSIKAIRNYKSVINSWELKK